MTHGAAAIVGPLRNDPLSAPRESSDELAPRLAAIDAYPGEHLIVVRDAQGAVVGTAHLTLPYSLSRGGATRLLVEAVRVGASHEGFTLVL